MTTTPTRKPDVTYSPTATSDQARPRTQMLEFWAEEELVRVTWRDGSQYFYLAIGRELWGQWVESPSPGRFVNTIVAAGIKYQPCTDEIVLWPPTFAP